MYLSRLNYILKYLGDYILNPLDILYKEENNRKHLFLEA